MYSEFTLTKFSLDRLFALMVITLREMERLDKENVDIKIRISKREELETIQMIIDEKRH